MPRQLRSEMARRIVPGLMLLALGGCGMGGLGGSPSLSVVCPAALPTVTVTELADHPPESLVELQAAYLQARAGYDDLHALREATEHAWERCKRRVG